MNIFITTESRISSRNAEAYNEYMKSWASQGRRLGDKRLEVVEAADVFLHVAGHWAAVEDVRNGTEEWRGKCEYKLVLNKYNTSTRL
jgi:hypothetical protein